MSGRVPWEGLGPGSAGTARRFFGGVLVSLAFLMGPDPLVAQETIASDRPGIGSGSFVLHPGTLQMEAGVGFSESGSVTRFSLGQLLLRVGALERLEVQGQFNSLVFDRGGETDRGGVQDLGLGAKLRLIRDGPGGMSLSFQGALSFPTGSRFTSSKEVIPTVALLADVPVARNLALSGNLAFGGWLAGAEDVVTVTLTPSYALPTSAPMGIFLGYAGFFAATQSQHFLEGGVTWLPTPDLQLDANGGLDPDSGDYFMGIGVATRWSF